MAAATAASVPQPLPSPAIDGLAEPDAEGAGDDPALDHAAADPADAEAARRRAAKRRPAGPSRPAAAAAAANDDAPSIGGLIFALHQKPSRRPVQLAAIASIVWGLLGIVLGWAMLAPELQRAPTFAEMLTRPTAITLAATVLIPIALFWFLAMLVWRAQELKLMSSAMTEVAIRLAEPDRMAEQQIASVGQAVRRQVSHMNDALSRALGRASELEALVHNEVSNLERSYVLNEHRIHGLLQELSGERHALINTSERVNISLKELGSEIPVLVDKLSEQQIRLASFIEDAGRNIVALETSINDSSSHLALTVGARTDDLRGLLESKSQELGGLLGAGVARIESGMEERMGALGATLAQHTDTLQGSFESFSQGLDAALGARTSDLQTVLEEYTRALDQTMESRQQTLDSQLVARTRALDDAFAARLTLFDESIVRSTIAIDSMVADKARALSGVLENHAREVGQVLGQRAGELDEQITQGVQAVRRASDNVTRQSLKAIEGLAGQTDLLRNVSENLVNQIHGVTNRFDQQGQSIVRAANALETANFRIDKMLQHRQTELSETLEQLSGKAGEIDTVMRGYSTSLEGTFDAAETRARSVGEALARGAEERSRMTLEEIERLRAATAGETDRALADLRSKFQNVSREVSHEIGSLSSQFHETSDDVRRKAQQTLVEIEREQSRLNEQLARLPEATRASAETMRASLQEQLKALEQLSQLSQRESARTDVSLPLSLPHAPGPAAAAPPPSRSISSVTHSLATELASRGRSLDPRGVPGTAAAPPPAPDPRAGRPAAPAVVPAASGNQAHGQPHSQPHTQSHTQSPGQPKGEGWSLGDLLARASQDHETESPRSPLDIDVISRALDATTASAIWSRFRAGQRGVMVRSIYSLDGRTAFDEVHRRYQSDMAFRQTVDRYILDFEQLLRDSEQRDASGRTTQAYVTSDSGRVYLFLAHASGRLV